MIAAEARKARDLELIDAIDALSREPFEGRVWRVVREGRDPAFGGSSLSRWCNGRFDVLYTSFNRDGAIAEIHALLSEQPVFPSKMTWLCYELEARSLKTLRLSDMSTLETLGVETSAHRQRRYDRTQSIADAAFFLGFDGIVAPSARWNCQNLVIFTDRSGPDDISAVSDRGVAVDWAQWRRQNQGRL